MASLLALSCASGPPVELPGRQPPAPGCTIGERTEAACATMKHAILLDANGAPLRSKLTSCDLVDLDATLEWLVLGDVDRTYRAVMRFGLDGPRGALRPSAARPFVYEWPRPSPDHEPRAMKISVPERCTPDQGKLVSIKLDLPAIDASSCLGESFEKEGEPRWCQMTPPGREVYRIRERLIVNLSRYHQVDIVFESGHAKVTLDGRTVQIEDAKPLWAMFNEIWDVPSEKGESCRDGVLTRVEGRRADRWKVVRRRCKSLINFDRVSQAVGDAAKSSP